jgi:hypothetical protein
MDEWLTHFHRIRCVLDSSRGRTSLLRVLLILVNMPKCNACLNFLEAYDSDPNIILSLLVPLGRSMGPSFLCNCNSTEFI